MYSSFMRSFSLFEGTPEARQCFQHSSGFAFCVALIGTGVRWLLGERRGDLQSADTGRQNVGRS